MNLRKVEAANDPPPLLERIIENYSSLDIGMDEQKEEMANDLPMLPLELLVEIFLLLPLKHLMRLKCVCKSWYAQLSSPGFIKLYHSLQANFNGILILHKKSFLYTVDFHEPHCRATKLCYPESINCDQSCKLVGSCNGLLCFKLDDHLALCNPLTQWYTILPEFNETEKFCERDRVELAYDCISDDYKVLVFSELKNPRSYEWESREIFLYSLRTNAWEIIAKPPWDWNSFKSPSVAVRNTLHWMDRKYEAIKCFDLSTQRYFEISLPEKVSPGYEPKLAVLRRQLCIVTLYFDIWILKDYGVVESWTRLFRCPAMEWHNLYKSASGLICWRPGYLSLACSKDVCKILIVLGGGQQRFICCDLKSKEVRKMEFPGLPCGFSAILPWLPSLAPLSV